MAAEERTAHGAAAAEQTDAGVLSAALEVHAHLEIEQLLQRLLEQAVAWLDAECGFALAPGEARSTWSPIASTVA